MSINHFIPQVWSARILQALQKSLVYAQPGVVNRDYEGDIAEMGDSVNIQSIGDPTIFDYTKNTSIPAPETLTDIQRTLLIDAAKGFNFEVDDVDRRQAMGGFMGEAMNRAGYRLKDAMDSYLAGKMVAGASFAIGSAGSPAIVDNAAVYAYNLLVQAKVQLDEVNAPTDGRFAIVPSWFEASLALDSRFVGTRGYDANSVLLNGSTGNAAGFNILVSNNVPYTPGSPAVKYQIVCGAAGATTLAEQINKVEAYRPPDKFADAVKGLHLYGGKVIRGYEMVLITANDGLGLAGSGPQDLPA